MSHQEFTRTEPIPIAAAYPTDLTDAEIHRAQARLRGMADDFTAAGVLRDPRLRAAFEGTWRHPYIPAYYPAEDDRPVLCVDPERRTEWLDTVYSNVTLLTKVVPVPLSPTLAPATANAAVSSSTLPYLVVEMLEQLDLRDGHRVLEVGTGTGYNAAVLCARLGDANVTTVDVDSQLTELARERLAANGHRPTVVAVDGLAGYPDNGPYDRIIATCAVTAVPYSWLQQAAPGAVVLVDIHGRLGGTLVRLVVGRDHVGSGDGRPMATGRFVSYWTGFMPMRHSEPRRPGASLVKSDPVGGWTSIDPTTIGSSLELSFTLQWHLPDVTYGVGTDQDGGPAVALIADDGGYVDVSCTPTPSGYRTLEHGTSRIVERLNEAVRFWEHHQHPRYDRFGLTVTSDQQYVWLDDSVTGPRWTLPAPVQQRPQ